MTTGLQYVRVTFRRKNTYAVCFWCDVINANPLIFCGLSSYKIYSARFIGFTRSFLFHKESGDKKVMEETIKSVGQIKSRKEVKSENPITMEL